MEADTTTLLIGIDHRCLVGTDGEQQDTDWGGAIPKDGQDS